MRSPLWLLLLLFVAQVAIAQDTQTQRPMKDVLYLKNGSVIKGEIIELQTDKSVKIRTADGSVFVFEFSQVEKIVKEEDTAPAAPVVAQPLRSQTAPVAAPPSRSTQFMIVGGVSLPVGAFGKTNDPEAGGAKTGFAVGADLVIPLQSVLHLQLTGQYTSNAFNTEELVNMVQQMLPGATVNIDAKAWKTIWVMGGLGFGTNSGTGTDFDVTALAGVVFGTSPEVSGTVTYMGYTSTTTQPSISASAFAFGGSMRLILSNFVIGAKYLGSKPKYEETSGSFTSTMEQKTEMIVIYAGIAF